MASPFKTLHTNPQHIQQYAACLGMLRSFFAERGICEVITPTLAATTIPDPHIASISCQLAMDCTTAYLQTSPEFAMKRLLASGSGSIYQIGPAFRDDMASPIHKVEFTLLEWYRVGWDYQQLMREVYALLQLFWPDLAWRQMRYHQIFMEYMGIDISAVTLERLQQLLQQHAKITTPFASRDAALDAVMSLLIQPMLSDIPMIFITDYPLSQAALARASTSQPGVAERFECFLYGVEVANGFSELTNPTEQRQRFERDNAYRRQAGLPVLAIDEDFLAALSYMPDCAGVALGIDRLFKTWVKKASI